MKLIPTGRTMSASGIGMPSPTVSSSPLISGVKKP